MYRLEIFEILRNVMAILVLVEHFSGKFCLNFLTLILSTSPNMVRFVCTFSIMHATTYCYRRGSKSWKICIYQKHS